MQEAVTVEDMRTKFLGTKLMLMADDGAVTSVNVTLKNGVSYRRSLVLVSTFEQGRSIYTSR